MTEDISIDLEAVNPVSAPTVEPIAVQELDVVFVPFEDTQIRVNQTTKDLKQGVSYKVSRDEARILIDAKKGYLKD